MDLRSGSFSQPAVPAPHDPRWRVSAKLTLLKVGMTIGFVAVAVLLAADRRAVVVACLAALIVGGYAVRDLIAPVRLSADAEGVTVIAGFAGRRWLPWSQIERVRVDERTRGGLRSQLLEIDTGDNLYLLSTFDLNARCDDVAAELLRIRGF